VLTLITAGCLGEPLKGELFTNTFKSNKTSPSLVLPVKVSGQTPKLSLFYSVCVRPGRSLAVLIPLWRISSGNDSNRPVNGYWINEYFVYSYLHCSLFDKIS
jgi:hypothetical protein